MNHLVELVERWPGRSLEAYSCWAHHGCREAAQYLALAAEQDMVRQDPAGRYWPVERITVRLIGKIKPDPRRASFRRFWDRIRQETQERRAI